MALSTKFCDDHQYHARANLTSDKFPSEVIRINQVTSGYVICYTCITQHSNLGSLRPAPSISCKVICVDMNWILYKAVEFAWYKSRGKGPDVKCPRPRGKHPLYIGEGPKPSKVNSRAKAHAFSVLRDAIYN